MIRTIELPKDSKTHDQAIADDVEFERKWADIQRGLHEHYLTVQQAVIAAQREQFEEWDRKDKTLLGRFRKWWEAL